MIVKDSFGREIDYLRVSVTDRCNLRCVYCMPAEGVEKRTCGETISYEDIVRVCQALASLGIRKIKITGGEPLVRKDVVHLVERVKALPGIDNVTMTTNGILLPGLAGQLRDAGLGGVNLSLDTLNPDLYRRLTRFGDVDQALAGLDSAVSAGIPSVKVNCVPLGGVDGQDLAGVAALAKERPIHVRFIEMMPLGMGADHLPVGRRRVRRILETAFGPLRPCRVSLGNGPARYYDIDGFAGRIGFIDTLDHRLCGSCNRLRLTSDGCLKTCLHMDRGVSLAPVLASGDEAAFVAALRRAIMAKPAHHSFIEAAPEGAEQRIMSQIGG